jgi:hypothetical protein
LFDHAFYFYSGLRPSGHANPELVASGHYSVSQMLPTANSNNDAFWRGGREERQKWVTGRGEAVVVPVRGKEVVVGRTTWSPAAGNRVSSSATFQDGGQTSSLRRKLGQESAASPDLAQEHSASAPHLVLGEPGALSSPLSNARQAGRSEFVLPQPPFPPAVAMRKVVIPLARYAAPRGH